LIEENGHATDLITREAVQWLETRSERPFLLYLPYTAVHIPIREPEEYLKRVPTEITEPSRREFAACVMHLDEAVGRVLAALEKSGKAGNTLVIFTSDNGGYTDARNNDPQYPSDNYTTGPAGGNNRPLRGMKTTVYEGGIRVPTLVHWPGRLKPGQVTTPVHVSDWMPTFCRLAGYGADKDLRWDGHDLWPLLGSGEAPPARTIYVAGPGFKAQAVREGNWKLVAPRTGAVELFDLSSDPNETTDLAATHPDRVAELRGKLAEASRRDRDAVGRTGRQSPRQFRVKPGERRWKPPNLALIRIWMIPYSDLEAGIGP
jgi:arylsulfatase A-like enzyme